jgi:hypothetical protein
VKRPVFHASIAIAVLGLVTLAGCGGVAANPEAPPSGFANLFYVFWWLLGVGGSALALFQAWQFFQWMEAQPAGTQKMIDIAGYVRTGADAYLKQQYKVVGWAFLAIAILLLWMALGLGVQSLWVPFAFLSGGFFSGLAGWFGMKTATLASNRTAAGAERSLNEGLQIAFRSGAVMGLTVVGLGLLDIMLWFFILYWLVPMLGFKPLSLEEITVTMLCFGMGASTQALFARVGGGIFTKAADVGADLVGKVEHSIPEDDPRNPATISTRATVARSWPRPPSAWPPSRATARCNSMPSSCRWRSRRSARCFPSGASIRFGRRKTPPRRRCSRPWRRESTSRPWPSWPPPS